MLQNRSFLLFPTNGSSYQSFESLLWATFYPHPTYFSSAINFSIASFKLKCTHHFKKIRSILSIPGLFIRRQWKLSYCNLCSYIKTTKFQFSYQFWQNDAEGNCSHYSHKTFILLSYDVNKQKVFNGIQLLGIT